MKKILFIALFSIISLVGYADPVEEIAEEVTSSTITQREVYDDVKDFLSQLAEGLGTAAEHVYPIFVRQQVVEGASFLLILVIGIVVVCTCANNIFKIASKDDTSDTEDVILGLSAAIGFISLIAVVLGIFNVDIHLGKIINPEYAAIKEIVGMIK